MTPIRQRRVNRSLKTAAVGALALSAAVALPAFTRSTDDVVPVAATVTAEVAEARVATERYQTIAVAYEAERQRVEIAGIVAAIAAMPPDAQFNLKWEAMTDVERAATVEYFAAVEAEARAEAERAAAEAARAEAARAEAARAETARRSSRVTSSGGNGVWDTIAQCESGGNWSMNTGNGFTGGLQFMTSTWLAQGGGKYAPAAYLATPSQQIEIAERTLASGGWGQWPACSRKAGLR